MKKMISAVAIGALLVTGFLLAQPQEDVSIGPRHPGVLSVPQPTHFF
ncbi:hypothetical protein [Virgibacillus sp. YIM 98842]|nr:hypothetical protein [Virgibacillus sp. YIM 98842]